VDSLSEDVKGVKGDDRDAPALNRALEMAKAGLYDVLVIRDVKRFSRDVYKAMDFESRFFDNGIDIEYSWNKELNGLPRRGTGFVMRFLQYWMSEEDRKDIASKLYFKRVESVRDKGNVLTKKRPPYGYKEQTITVDGKKKRTLVVFEDEAKWVRQMFEWYAFEGESLRGVTRRLRDNLVLKPSETKPDTGKGARADTGPYDWSHRTVKQILSRETYIGTWGYGKRQHTKQTSIIADELIPEPVTVEVPAIISQDVFDLVQEKIKKNGKDLRGKSKYKFLFRGRSYCGLCDSSIKCEGDKRCNYRVYRCNSKVNGNLAKTKCELPNFKRDIIDQETWQWLTESMNDEEKLRQGYQEYLDLRQDEVTPLQDELRRIEANLSDLQAKLDQQIGAVKMLIEIGSTKATDSLKAEIMTTEDLITRNENRQAEIEAKLKDKAVDVAIVTDFDSFVETVRAGIEKAHGNFEAQVKIIEALDVTVELTVKDGEPVFIPKCILRPNSNDTLYCSRVPKYRHRRYLERFQPRPWQFASTAANRRSHKQRQQWRATDQSRRSDHRH
ncbi:MAG: recombinase family protein, partial [Chloroflexota bacterium]|nr:recombinase family protein [Chloroflexota bacterium]